MEQASSAFYTGVPALAAIPQLAGNSRQGFGPVGSTMHWASGWVISSPALGIKGLLYDGDAGSRSTGKERDSESGLDDFGARYYASNLGRFMSPDWDEKPTAVPYAAFGDPQTLNLFAYVENAPLNRVDAMGHFANPAAAGVDEFAQSQGIQGICGLYGEGEGCDISMAESEMNSEEASNEREG